MSSHPHALRCPLGGERGIRDPHCYWEPSTKCCRALGKVLEKLIFQEKWDFSELFRLQNLCFWPNATCLWKVLFWIFFFFPMWCECSYSCSGNCNPVPVEMPASSFPATLAARVHGVFSSLSADWCSNDSREELWPGQFGEGNFGRDAEHRGAVCSVPRCLLGEGNSSRYILQGKQVALLIVGCPQKIPQSASVTISSVTLESKAVTSLSGMKNRGTARL